MNSTEKNSRHLRRELGLFSGVSLVAGLTIGSGIYYLGNYVLQRTNMSLGMALICWIVGGVVSILGGLCFAELGAEMPVTGGLTTYLSKAYHPALGFVNGFSAFLLTASGSIAALALAAGNAVNGMAGGVLSLWTVKCVAIGLIVLFTVLNLRGIKGAAIFQNLSMIVRFLPLALVIVLGLLLGQQNPDLSPATAFTEGQSVTAASVIKMVGFATFASLWAYEGWTELNIVAGEMKRPRKDIPLAIILSMGAITLIYTLFNLAIYRILPHSEIVSVIEANEDSYLGQIAAERIMGSAGKWIVLIGMFAGIVGIVNGDVMVFPRTYYAMAKGGFFFRKMGEINEKGVPQNAILASSGMAVLLVLFNSLQELTDWLITVTALINLLAIVAVLVFRIRYPDMERPYKVWGGVTVIVLAIVCFVILLVNNFISDPVTSLKGLGIIAVCIPFYFLFRRMNGGVEYDTDKIDN